MQGHRIRTEPCPQGGQPEGQRWRRRPRSGCGRRLRGGRPTDQQGPRCRRNGFRASTSPTHRSRRLDVAHPSKHPLKGHLLGESALQLVSRPLDGPARCLGSRSPSHAGTSGTSVLVRSLTGEARPPPRVKASWWSWRESNPRPRSARSSCYDRSRDRGLSLPRARVPMSPRLPRGAAVFPAVNRSLPVVHHRFCCRVAVVRPRVPSLVAV